MMKPVILCADYYRGPLPPPLLFCSIEKTVLSKSYNTPSVSEKVLLLQKFVAFFFLLLKFAVFVCIFNFL